MKSFKEYWNEHGDVYAMEIAEDAWDYQQSKIDELQAKLDQAYEDIETFATAHQRECEFKAQFAKEKD